MRMIKSTTVLVKDTRGIPSVMERFEKCLHKEVDPTVTTDEVHPVFRIRGKEVDAIYLPKYISCMIDAIPYSLPLQTPATGPNIEKLISAHRKKGDGWHVMTAVEWKFIEDIIRLSGKEVHGNTYFGKYFYDESERGIPSETCIEMTLTGSGPDTWYTGGTKDGIADFVGNVWKQITGIRMMDGKLQYIKDNDAAAPDCDLSMDSAEWVDALIDGKPLRADYHGGKVYFNAEERETTNSYGRCRWQDAVIDVSRIPDEVKALGILPIEQTNNGAVVYVDTEKEVMPIRGGAFYYTSYCGVNAVHMHDLRNNEVGSFGFFSAYYET